jgi:signal transduction histidine kinase/CheY-like chemotaxis protein
MRIHLVGLALVIAVPLLGLTIASEFKAADTAVAAESDLLQLQAKVLAKTLEHDIGAARMLVQALQSNPQVALLESGSCKDLLPKLRQTENSHLDNLFVLSPDGKIGCSDLQADASLSLADHSFFTRALQSDDFVVGHPRVSVTTGHWVWPVALSLRDSQGRRKAVVAVKVNIQAAVDETFAGWSLGTLQSVLIKEKSGLTRYTWPASNAAAGGPSPAVDGEQISGVAPLLGGDYSIVVQAPKSQTLAPHNAALQRNLILIGLTILVASAAAWMLARRYVVEPLRRLTGATEKLIAGDLQVRTASSSDIEEFRILSSAFDTMAERLSGRMSELQASEARVRRQLAHMSLLDQTTRAVGEALNLEHVFDVTAETMLVRMPVDFASVLIHKPLQQALDIKSACNSGAIRLDGALLKGQSVSIDQNGLATCLAGRLVYEPDTCAIDFPFPSLLAGAGIRSLVLAPLRAQGRVFGLLAMGRRDRDAFSSVDCEFLRQLGDNVALAITQAELHGSLKVAYEDLKSSQQTVMHNERLRLLGQMSSGIAHDVNNALSPVALYADALLLNEHSLSDRGRVALLQIQRSIDDVSATLARLRDFYRKPDKGGDLVSIALNELCDQVLELCKAKWHDIPLQRGLVIKVERSYALTKPSIHGTLSEIRDAMVNLVVNAVDAMTEGGTLTVSTRIQDGLTGEEAVLEVRDTGVGMDSETRERCLEPFFTTKGERGTGLGLATVFGAVQRHGGQITIDSEPGVGTCVRLTFTADATEAALAQSHQPVIPSEPCRLLLIDDDAIALKSVADVLQADGHTVVALGNSLEAVEVFARAQLGPEPFELVITDLGMPRMDGRAVAAAIKRISFRTPVIMLTGWGQRLLDDPDGATGVDYLIQKPPRLTSLRQALSQLVKRPG